MAKIIRSKYFQELHEESQRYYEQTEKIPRSNISDSGLHYRMTLDAYAKENDITWEPTAENDKKLEKLVFQEIGDPYSEYYFADPKHYINILDEFVRTGQVPDHAAPWEDEYLEKYLREVMGDPFVAYSVLSDEVKARVFYDNMLAFIKQIITRESFRKTCAQGQTQKMQQAMQWSERKKRDGWSRLLSEISDEYEEFGFDERYYRDKFGDEGELADEETWKKMIEDWSRAFDQKQQQLRQRDIDEIKDNNSNILKHNLSAIPDYLKEKGVEKEQFYQAWGLMGGQWNSLLFDQHLKIVAWQKRYPQLEQMAGKMGRMADDEATERMPVAIGGNMKMEHAAKSDILGVALSKEGNAMPRATITFPMITGINAVISGMAFVIPSEIAKIICKTAEINELNVLGSVNVVTIWLITSTMAGINSGAFSEKASAKYNIKSNAVLSNKPILSISTDVICPIIRTADSAKYGMAEIIPCKSSEITELPDESNVGRLEEMAVIRDVMILVPTLIKRGSMESRFSTKEFTPSSIMPKPSLSLPIMISVKPSATVVMDGRKSPRRLFLNPSNAVPKS